MTPPKNECDYVTRRECDSMHNSSKFIQGGIVTLFLGIIGVGIWIAQVSASAESRSQRNEQSIENIQTSIVEVKTTINKGFDDIKTELREQRSRNQ